MTDEARTFPRTRLPNGDEILHLNEHETRFLYDEIYVQQIYLKHIPPLPENAVVVDVGANIGLFARFICQRFAAARVICFEPAPEALAILTKNVEEFGKRVTIVAEGLSDHTGTADFTYYPNYTIMSGFHADKLRDQALLKHAAARQLEGRGLQNADDHMLEALTSPKVATARRYRCLLNTLSHHIDRLEIGAIDLLKVDVERSELAVLQGVESRHWRLISRVNAEIHDEGEGELAQAKKLLSDQGMTTEVEVESQLQGAGVFTLFGWRA